MSIKVGNSKYINYPEAEIDQIVTISFRCHTQSQVDAAMSYIKTHNELKVKECPWIEKYFTEPGSKK